MTYSGSNDGCTLRPPYFAPFNNLDGMKSPKDTAIIKFIGAPWGDGGY